LALLLREKDVERLLDMPTALACVERAFVELGHGRATNLPRTRIHQKHGGLNLMAAGLPTFGVIGFKAYTWFTSGSKFMVNLYHSETGELLAIIEADRMGQMRTGAASGIATKWMARAEAASIGIFGTGYQAQTQLMAVCAVRKIRRVRAFSRKTERRQAFCKTMEAALKLEVQPVTEARSVVEGSDIIITATTSTEPLFDGDWVGKGAHLNVIGGNSPIRVEVDTTTVLRSSWIVVDSLDQAKAEAGDFLKCVERGLMYWERVEELGSVVTGRSKGRTSNEEITFFKSLGIALEDLAVGAAVYERALEQKAGERILT
jgi:ornithine cyclodeaminase/alanine dehydrogenase-like protein (mu-crystallin family)